MVMVMRGLLTNREVEVVTGNDQEKLSMIEQQTSARIAISPSMEGMEDRVLTVAGEFSAMADAFMLVGTRIAMDSRTRELPILGTGERRVLSINASFVRLLVANSLVGTIIGRDGLTISHIQGNSGARVVALKEQLKYSNERIVEVQGSIQQIRCAIEAIARHLVASWDKSLTTKHYMPCPTLNNRAIGNWLEPRESSHRYPGHEITQDSLKELVVSRPLVMPVKWARLHFHSIEGQLISLVGEEEQMSFLLDEDQPNPAFLAITIAGTACAVIRVYEFMLSLIYGPNLK
ncbi:RNA binding protein, heterogenous nuclear RNP-K like protein [Entomophthora muscae]|uniref:RNA binding protein, heterogenous nuclear RNP-K like protein n=1 Tax=Entomophthora muscae TaxID=34485 RepID=A0ACC2TQ16_9FUNG|nr:RNA binding protein, heterogenous nuclear RNP-K like protein [Entomophthora muscae]